MLELGGRLGGEGTKLKKSYSAELFFCIFKNLLIRFSGPITVADYMREVLTNPIQVYYMLINTGGVSITGPHVAYTTTVIVRRRGKSIKS